MYTVEWCDHEGNLQFDEYEYFEDAQFAADDIYQERDGVRILDPNGNEIVSY